MSDDRNFPRAADSIALSLWLGVGSVAVILCGRALAGALESPVGAGIPVLVTSVMLLASVAAWRLFHRDGRRGDAARRLLDGLVALAPVAMSAAAISVNASAGTLALLAGLLLCGVAALVACETTRSSRRADLLSGNAGSATACPTSQDLPAQPGPPVGAADPGGIVDGAVPADGPSDPEIPLHEHFSRRSLAGGGEQIEAVVIARFLAGQRQTAVHLPIHPVLPRVPHVECEPLDDSAVELQVTAVYGYGVRVEVKRTADLAAEAAVPIGLLLTTDDRGICAA